MRDEGAGGGYVGIIPARAGSKRLPGKNMRPLAGLPMVGHTLRAALQSNSLARVVVSSDDEALLAYARDAGAHACLSRGAELASDDAQTIDVVRDVLDRERAAGRPIDRLVLLQPTSPLRSAADIDAAIALHRAAPGRGLVSVVVTGNGPAKWTGDIRDGLFELDLEADTPRAYRLNGAIYVCGREQLLRDGSFSAGRLTPYVMPAARSIDIDTLQDFDAALKQLG